VKSIGDGDPRLTVIMRRFAALWRAGRRASFGVAPKFTTMHDALH